MITCDTGYVIYCEQRDVFYTGMGFNKSIRFAQIYHDLKFVREAIKNMPHKFPYTKDDTFEVFPISIRLTSSFPVDVNKDSKKLY